MMHRRNHVLAEFGTHGGLRAQESSAGATAGLRPPGRSDEPGHARQRASGDQLGTDTSVGGNGPRL